MRVLRSLEELDEALAECDRAERVSDDAMRAVFGTFRIDPPAGMPEDPFSDAYRQAQMGIYATIAGRDYALANEATPLDVDAALRRPFPYSTGSATTAGEHLMGIGFALRAMALPPGSRVLEFGPGWGNTTLELARLGHHVTCVDVEPRFCELIRRRAAREDLSIEVVQDDFFWAERSTATFDAVLFFECFHHCADHLRLLRALQARVAEGGRLFFGGEPITADFPQPWGVRLDGNSLWAIRKNGWLELGFHQDYFQRALARTGWSGRRIPCADPPWATVWEARRLTKMALYLHASDDRVQTATGQREGGAILLDGTAGTGLYGPYVPLARGRWTARLHFRPDAPASGTAVMDVSAANGSARLAARAVQGEALVAEGWVATLPFEAAEDLIGVEVRLFCERGFTAVIEAVELLPGNVD
ncbi:class I SAM-dependent methyltransferase [Pararoseomonas indoligenes]|uniref:Class I SAM-dependent methyltransferase n=1 Tax=Roseomonas indoligenes TaxID=2820811 RepID=A0A940S6S8_9PROT|nr:class I SAM-dependent methyltransferase [Pararoseomonas indoligenes]MBP0492357.1 class I SAM-dependent methyltransferase [Pararoseomonas indoligenes]